MIALVVVPMLMLACAFTLWLPIANLIDSQHQWRQDARRLLSLAKLGPEEGAALDRQIEAMYASEIWSKFYPGGQSVSGTTVLHSDVSASSCHSSARSVSASQPHCG
jgi:hypothetical protein